MTEMQTGTSGQGPAIQVIGLGKRFGEFIAVDDISLQVERGEIFGFLGPNGAGKTTTIRMLLSLLPPSSGSAKVLGYDVVDEVAEIRPRIGYMSQRFSLYNDLTVAQNLAFFGGTYGLRGARLRKRTTQVLAMAELQGREGARTGTLSGGYRQRLALGCAILSEPEVLFLDEPTAGVDPISRRSFWELLYDLSDRGHTIFVTTHYMDEAEHCHRLAFIQRGRLVGCGSPSEIKRDQMTGQVYEIDCASPGQAVGVLRAHGGFSEVSLYGAQVHVVTVAQTGVEIGIEQVLAAAGILASQIRAISPSLEDVFIASVQRSE